MSKNRQFLVYVTDINLLDVMDAEPTELVSHGSTFIVGALSKWSGAVYEPGDLVTWNKYCTAYQHTGKVTAGNHFLIGGYKNPAVGTMFSAYDKQIVQYLGGALNDPSSWKLTYDDIGDNALTQCSNLASMFAILDFVYNKTDNTWSTPSVSDQAEDIGYTTKCKDSGDSGEGSVDKLSELTDVSITTPGEGDTLVYNPAVQKWLSGPVPSKVTTIISSAANLGVGTVVTFEGGTLGLASSSTEMVFGIVVSKNDDEYRVQTVGVIDGLSGLTVGSAYFVSDTPGQLSATPPNEEGKYVILLGYAVSTTELLLNVQPPIEL